MKKIIGRIILTDIYLISGVTICAVISIFIGAWLLQKRGRSPLVQSLKTIGIALCSMLLCLTSLGLFINLSGNYLTTVYELKMAIHPGNNSLKKITVTDYPAPVSPTSNPNPAAAVAPLPADTDPAPNDPNYRVKLEKQTNPFNTTYLFRWTGPKSKITGQVLFALPKDYSPQDGKTYQIIEIFLGYPGHVDWFPMNLKQELMAAPAKSQKTDLPTILVIPEINLNHTAATCADVKNGVQLTTWLNHDIPKLVRTLFPNVSDNRSNWTAFGYSSGAYCAIRSGIVSGNVFGNAVSFSGYDAPEVGFWGNSAFNTYKENTLTVLLTRPRPWPVNMYFLGTKNDLDSLLLANNIRHTRLQHGDDILVNTSANGGHNWETWKAEIPKVINWLSAKHSKIVSTSTPLPAGKITYQGIIHQGSTNPGTFSFLGLGTVTLTVIFALLLFIFGVGYQYKQAKTVDIRAQKPANKRTFGTNYWLTCFWLLLTDLTFSLAVGLLFNRSQQFYTTLSEFINSLVGS